MRQYIVVVILFLASYVSAFQTTLKNKREQILRDESLRAVGGNMTLTDKEIVVNNCLMQHKFQELDYAFNNPDYCNFSHHYFTYKEKIKDSKVYQIIKDMPKGAALHLHDMGVLGPDYLMNLTYREHLYVCFEKEYMKLKFSDKTPKTKCNGFWQLMSDARTKTKDLKEFDRNVRNYFTLVVKDADVAYPTIKETWDKFMKYFGTVAPLLSFRPIWEKYFYDALKLLREHNIMYVEIRSILPKLYELDGTEYDQLITAKSYKKAINRFVKDYPDCVGAKLIFAPSRNVDRHTVDAYIELARRIKQAIPDKFAGFDLVGEEDLGKPLIEFEDQLVKASKDLDYFFHAGETDWYGFTTDENMIDAILLGAKRIGHAYALTKHPLMFEEVAKRDIGLEVNVISNAVLSLVRDVRNHPLSVFLANGLPVVISSDDPGVWEADPISEDFYITFVGVASRLSDLRMLKALALNSLKFSALNPEEKPRAIDSFNLKWNHFIDKFDCSLY